MQIRRINVKKKAVEKMFEQFMQRTVKEMNEINKCDGGFTEREKHLIQIGYLGRIREERMDMIPMVEYEGNFIPEELCTMTNPATTVGGKSVPDDCISCDDYCTTVCSECMIQKLFNEYAKITLQDVIKAEEETDKEKCKECGEENCEECLLEGACRR